MKGKRNFLIGLVLGALICGVLGFFFAAFISKDSSFLLGFLTCLLLVSLGLLLWWMGNQQGFWNRGPKKNDGTSDFQWSNGSARLLVPVFLGLICLCSGLLIFRQNVLFENQVLQQQEQMAQQAELVASVRISSLVSLMSNILETVEEEIKNRPHRTLSEETIARIVALSHALQPYGEWEGDSLSEKKISPERGQLLLTLSILKIDSSSFDRIKALAPFSGADLEGADLRGADLRGVNLRGANLQEADLRQANLNGADMRGANLWGANLTGTQLREVYLNRADLRWAILNEADLRWAVLNGADLTNAKLRKANLALGSMRWAFSSGALFGEASLVCVDLKGTDFRRADLRGADLTEADMGSTILNEADLRGANFTEVNLKGFNEVQLDKAVVAEADWLEKLVEWRVQGAEDIQRRFRLVIENPGFSDFRLEKR